MESSKELQIVVDFYRLFLKQPLNSDTRLVENYLSSMLDHLALLNAPPGGSLRDVLNYKGKLLEFIKSSG